MKKLIKLSVLALVIIGFSYYQNNVIVYNAINYTNPKIPQAFNGYKIVHLSDLHNKNFGKNQKKLIHKISKKEPDIIVITGDLIDSRKTNIEAAMALIKGIQTIAPIYYVPGNHEERSPEYIDLKNQLYKENVFVLENQSTLIYKNKDRIKISGLLDPEFHNKAMSDLISTMNLASDDFNILLSHRPEHFDTYVDCHVDLVFSGHAHGGQFRLPFIGGLLAPNQGWLPKLSEGAITKDQTTMVVSRGLGNSIFPQRLFNQPEIVVLTLNSNE